MFIKRPARSNITANPNDPRHIPDLISERINRPACDPLTAAEENAAATRIADQRTALWSALAIFVKPLRCRLSSACVAWARENDNDDEALLALTSCAVTLSALHDEMKSWTTAVRTLAAGLKRSKDSLAEHNLRLVVHCASKHGHATGWILPMADLIQEGAIGLMKAVCRFDPSRGWRFSTMATWWIDHHIGRAIADKARTIRLPVHIAEGKSKVAKAIASLAAAGIADPSDVMISRECTRRMLVAAAEKNGTPLPTAEDIERGMVASRKVTNAMTPRRVASIREAMCISTVSASTPIGGARNDDPDDRNILDVYPTHTGGPDVPVLAAETAAILDAALAKLPPTTAAIMRRRHGIGTGEEMTLAAIAVELELNVGRERVRQIQAMGMDRARGELSRMGVRAEDVAWA